MIRRRDERSTTRSEQKCGGLRRSRGRCDGDRSGVVPLTIAVAPHPVVVPRRSVLRRGVEHRGEESAKGIVLTGSVRRPAAVRRQHGFADVVRGVVGEVVSVLRVPDVRQVGQRSLGLLEEGDTATLVDLHPSSRCAATSASTARCCAVVSGVTATAGLR